LLQGYTRLVLVRAFRRLLNYPFLKSHDVRHKLVMLSLSGLANRAAAPRVGRAHTYHVGRAIIPALSYVLPVADCLNRLRAWFSALPTAGRPSRSTLPEAFAFI
jgi:hypothetical protein